MRAGKVKLWKQVEELLQRRPGWKLGAMSSPGAPRVWCYGTGMGTDLTVSGEGNSISVYLVDSEQEITLRTTEELEAWLREHKPAAFRETKDSLVDGLKKGRFLDWE